MLESAKRALEHGDKETARQILLDSIEQPALDTDTRLRALFYLSQLTDNVLDRVEYLTQAHAINPENPRILARLIESQLGLILQAKAAVRRGDRTSARQALSSLLSLGNLDPGEQTHALVDLSYCLDDAEESAYVLRKALATVYGRLRQLRSSTKLDAVLENPFISLEPDAFALVLRVTNLSDRPVAGIVATLIVENNVVSPIGGTDCVIGTLGPHSSRFFNLQVKQNRLLGEGHQITEAGFSISLKVASEGAEDVDLGIKKQTIKVVGNLAAEFGVEQIPKRFVVGKALDCNTHELFHGRKDILHMILGSFNEGVQTHHYYLDGIPRVGKTSVLKLLPSILPSYFVPVYFNFGSSALGQRGPIKWWQIFNELCFELSKAFAAMAPGLSGPDFASFECDPTHTFASFLASVKSAFPEKIPFFMLDEFPDLLSAVARTGMEGDRETVVLDQLRELLASGALCAILTGSVRYDDLHNVLDHRIVRSLTPLRVSFLSQESVGRILNAGVPSYVGIPYETVASVFDQSGGYPWLVQIYGSALVDRLNIEQRTIATPGDVAIITREVVLTTSYYFDNWWRAAHLGPAEEHFIEQLLINHPEVESVDVSDLLKSCQQEQPEFVRALKNLRASEVLDSSQTNAVRIRSAALRQWLTDQLLDGRLRIDRCRETAETAEGSVAVAIEPAT
jgi:hypothetical protein